MKLCIHCHGKGYVLIRMLNYAGVIPVYHDVKEKCRCCQGKGVESEA
jgi:DnaJ-class molecular chaperone